MSANAVFLLYKVFKLVAKRELVGVYATREAANADKPNIKIHSMDDPDSYALWIERAIVRG